MTSPILTTRKLQSSSASNPTSPLELSFEIHPYVHSIERIAEDHGLHHDSGVSIRDKDGEGSSSKMFPPTQLNSGGVENSTTSQQTFLPQKRFIMTPSESFASLKRPSSSTADGGESRVKRIIESPGVTGEFDAHEDIWLDLARRLKPFGDTLRHERLRSILGDTNLADDCVGLLRFSTGLYNPESVALPQAQVEMMRILANLCIDHDDNREKLLEKGAPQAISSLLQVALASDEPTFESGTMTLLRTAAGALLNMQLDHASTQSALRSDPKTIGMLLNLATDERVYILGDWYRPQRSHSRVDSNEWKNHVSTGSSISTWAWRIVQDVCSGDEEDGNAKSDNMEKTSSSDEGEKPIESLLSIGEPSTLVAILIQPLKAIVPPSSTSPTSKGEWDADDVSDMMESDMDIIQIATELIESCSLDSRQFRIAALDKQANLDDAMSMLEFLAKYAESAQQPMAWSVERNEVDDLPPKPSDEETAKEVLTKFARARAAISRAIVSIVGEDENMSKLFEGQGSGQGGWFTERMKKWMTRDAKESDDLVSTAMLAVGNLARKDAHCIALVHEHHIVDTLTELLEPHADIKVAHGTICLLKNLAIPAQNKSIIGASNKLISRLAAFMDKSRDNVQPLQFATVGLLKHLCSANVENSYDLVLGDTLQVLLDLISRTDDVPTRMEGTRVLVNAIKSLWSTALTPSPSKDVETSLPDQADRQRARQKLTCEPVVLALAEMVKSSTKYPVLVNEGILALTLIAASMADQFTSGAILVARALQTITTSRKSSTGPNQESNKAGASGAEEADKVPKLPQRQTTLDALASNAPNALPVLRSGADMIATVLARRDARMPPQFANNACALIQALVTPSPKVIVDERPNPEQLSDEDPAEAVPEPVLSSPSSSTHNHVITSLVESWRPALEQLSTVGPQESLNVAQKALDTVKAFLK